MSTRAASAAKSLRAREALVNVLFGQTTGTQTTTNTVRTGQHSVDPSCLTHQKLKAEYLKRVQELHPDKHRSKTADADGGAGVVDEHDAKRKFVELKEAWNRYEERAKAMKVSKGQETAANFTMFGVGCSFSDNEEERALRGEIMDQASRGWFSAGALVDTDEESYPKKNTNDSGVHVALCDDNLFAPEEDEKEISGCRPDPSVTNTPRSSLVSHLIRASRR